MEKNHFQSLFQFTTPLRYASSHSPTKVLHLLEGLKDSLLDDPEFAKFFNNHFQLGINQVSIVLGIVEQFQEHSELIHEILILVAGFMQVNFSLFSHWLLEMICRFSDQKHLLSLLLKVAVDLCLDGFPSSSWNPEHVNKMIMQLCTIIFNFEESSINKLAFHLLFLLAQSLDQVELNLLKKITSNVFSFDSVDDSFLEFQIGILSSLLSLPENGKFLTFLLERLERIFSAPLVAFSSYEIFVQKYKFACKTFQLYLNRAFDYQPLVFKECLKSAMEKANLIYSNLEKEFVNLTLETADLFVSFADVPSILRAHDKELKFLLFQMAIKANLLSSAKENSQNLLIASKLLKLVSQFSPANTTANNQSILFNFFNNSIEVKRVFSVKIESDQPLVKVWSSIFFMLLTNINDLYMQLIFDNLKSESFPFYERIICDNFHLFITFSPSEYAPSCKQMIGVPFVKALLDQKRIQQFVSIFSDPYFHPQKEVLIFCFERAFEFKNEKLFIESLEMHFESLFDCKNSFGLLKDFLSLTKNSSVIEKIAIHLLPQDKSIINDVYLEDYSFVFSQLKLKESNSKETSSSVQFNLDEINSMANAEIASFAFQTFSAKLNASILKEIEFKLLSSIKIQNFSLMYALGFYLCQISMKIESCLLDHSCPLRSFYSCNFEEFRQWKLRILPAFARICDFLDSWPLFFTFYHSQLELICEIPSFSALIVGFCDSIMREKIPNSSSPAARPQTTIYQKYLREELSVQFDLIFRMGNYTSPLFNECLQRKFLKKHLQPIELDFHSSWKKHSQAFPIQQSNNLDSTNEKDFRFPHSSNESFWSEFNIFRNHLKRIILFPEEELLDALYKLQLSSPQSKEKLCEKFKISPESISSPDSIQASIKKLKNSLKHTPSQSKPLLFSFSHLLIPGTNHRLKAVGSEIVTIPSKTRPKRIFFVDEFGTKHWFLLKAYQEMQQESLVLSLFSLFNNHHHQQESKKTSIQGCPIKTFGIFPIDFNLALIEWIPNCDSCLNICKKDFDQTKGKSFLKCRILTESANEVAFFQKIINFTRSLATNNMFEYFLGIGDRHLDNILYNSHDSTLTMIDLTVCFGRGKSLAIPETVPFRLTSNFFEIVKNAKGACNEYYLNCCCNVLASIKQNISQYHELCPKRVQDLQRIETIEDDYLGDFVLELVQQATNAMNLQSMFKGWFSHL